uniref:Uncharacterized protein n=1 Tax=Romanomermis culicivorax TaxID=13658 RepID=A0A915HIT2_ROMCU
MLDLSTPIMFTAVSFGITVFCLCLCCNRELACLWNYARKKNHAMASNMNGAENGRRSAIEAVNMSNDNGDGVFRYDNVECFDLIECTV